MNIKKWFPWVFILNELFLYKVYQSILWKDADVCFSKLNILKMYGIKFNFVRIFDRIFSITCPFKMSELRNNLGDI